MLVRVKVQSVQSNKQYDRIAAIILVTIVTVNRAESVCMTQLSSA